MELWSRHNPYDLVRGGRGIQERMGEVEPDLPFGSRPPSPTSATFRFDIEVADVSGDLAYTMGYEHLKRSINSGLVEPKTVRVTHAYRREDCKWKIVLCRGDSPRLRSEPSRLIIDGGTNTRRHRPTYVRYCNNLPQVAEQPATRHIVGARRSKDGNYPAPFETEEEA
jgi:hypothetical protein